MTMSDASFQKHTYGRQPKHQMLPLESFDPWPEEYQGTARSNLKQFIEATKGMGLCVSLLFDPSTQMWKPSTNFAPPATPPEYNVLSKAAIQVEVQSFKKSLAVTEADVQNIEIKTRDQRESLEWFQFRRSESLLHTLVKSVNEENYQA